MVNSTEFVAGGSNTVSNFSHTADATTDVLVVGVTVFNASDVLSGITYNGVAMTRIDGQINGANVIWAYLYYLANPATGTNTLSITTSVSENPRGVAMDLDGGDTASPVDVSSKGQVSGTTLTATVVAATNDVMQIAHFGTNRDFSSAGANTTLVQEAGGAGYVDIRTTTNVNIGSTSISYVPSSSEPAAGYVSATFKSAVSSAVKTAEGLAIASVKTGLGLATASVKTWQGLA